MDTRAKSNYVYFLALTGRDLKKGFSRASKSIQNSKRSDNLGRVYSGDGKLTPETCKNY
jgi:hypothetical protein